MEVDLGVWQMVCGEASGRRMIWGLMLEAEVRVGRHGWVAWAFVFGKVVVRRVEICWMAEASKRAQRDPVGPCPKTGRTVAWQ